MIKRLYVDCETTGTDPQRHGLIQWSCIASIDGEQVADGLNLTIQPFENDVIEDGALEVNHITRAELFTADRFIPKHAKKLMDEYLGKHVDKFDTKDKFMFVGFRAGFDSDFTRAFFSKNGDNYYGSWFWVPPLDVMVLAAYLMQRVRHKLPNFKLRTVYEYLHPEKEGIWTEENWHDSMFDIERTIDIEKRLREIVAGKYKLTE